jgi:hypothetical protein
MVAQEPSFHLGLTDQKPWHLVDVDAAIAGRDTAALAVPLAAGQLN